MHKNEGARLATLFGLNLLDNLDDERYDRITKMVQSEFNMPIVCVSLVGHEREWFKASRWSLDCRQLTDADREFSFCGHAILNKPYEVFTIPDLCEDDRFADNPAVSGDLGLRFYAGVPLGLPSVNGADPVNSECMTVAFACLNLQTKLQNSCGCFLSFSSWGAVHDRPKAS